jgi:hypothetical protein
MLIVAFLLVMLVGVMLSFVTQNVLVIIARLFGFFKTANLKNSGVNWIQKLTLGGHRL